MMFIRIVTMVVAIGGKPWPDEVSMTPAYEPMHQPPAFPLCAYIKLWTSNSVINQELRDRKVENMTNATSSA